MRGTPRAFAAGLAAALAAAAAGPARAEPDTVAGGAHWRVATEGSGALHVWTPRDYRARDAGIVVYFHGYYTTVDEAWSEHRLAEQFRDSRRNAMFIVAESPTSNPDPVKWGNPDALLRTVGRRVAQALPKGPLVAVGHSGAFRTLVPWLASPRVTEMVVLDGLYRSEAQFGDWIRNDPQPGSRRLVLVGFDTAERTEKMLADVQTAVLLDGVPERIWELRRSQRRAPLIYLRSQYSHMDLVTEGHVLPMSLKLTRLQPI